MFLTYYGLREQPFGVTPDPRYLYQSLVHRETLASLVYGIESDLGFTSLIAEPGMGKTTLLYYLLSRYRDKARTAFLFETQCNSRELLQNLFSDLELDADTIDQVLLRSRFKTFLIAQARARRRVLVIIDEAQNLSNPALETVRLLSNFETSQAKLLHIILAGQPQLANKLARPELKQLRQRIAMFTRLTPFSAQDTKAYIEHRLQVAGYRGGALFTAEACEFITAETGGIPREINRLCFSALSLGCALESKLLDAQLVREASKDLQLLTDGTPDGEEADNESAGGDDDANRVNEDAAPRQSRAERIEVLGEDSVSSRLAGPEAGAILSQPAQNSGVVGTASPDRPGPQIDVCVAEGRTVDVGVSATAGLAAQPAKTGFAAGASLPAKQVRTGLAAVSGLSVQQAKTGPAGDPGQEASAMVRARPPMAGAVSTRIFHQPEAAAYPAPPCFLSGPSQDMMQKGAAAQVDPCARVTTAGGNGFTLYPALKSAPKDTSPAKAGVVGGLRPIGAVAAPPGTAAPASGARPVAGVRDSSQLPAPRPASKPMATGETTGGNRAAAGSVGGACPDINLSSDVLTPTRFNIGEFATIGVLCPLLVWLLAYAIVRYGPLAEAMIASH
jgi:type II secretory pathway predicted ATPase ExeA